jgi:hypothetical protein
MIRGFIEDLRLNWDNRYWWADHQIVVALVVAFIYVAASVLSAMAVRYL